MWKKNASGSMLTILPTEQFKPSDWKNARRRPERQANMLPREELIESKLEELINAGI
jgi:hypothetical protein